MDKGSRFGRDAAEAAWKSAEADAMFTLHAAGVRVPKPVLFYEGVLLMEVIGDAEGRVAPRLVDAGLTREQAGPLYETLRAEVVKMLCADLIHGDLSEFNVLLGAHGPVIIDFPQVVTAAKNSRAELFLKRDLRNLLRFFSSFDPALSAKHGRDADEVWRAYVRRELSPGWVPSEFRPRHHGAPRHHGGPGNPRPGPHPRREDGPPQRGGNRPPQGGRRGPEVVVRGQLPPRPGGTAGDAPAPRAESPAWKPGPERAMRGQLPARAGGPPRGGGESRPFGHGGHRRRPKRRF
jgi:RIO kinase 1